MREQEKLQLGAEATGLLHALRAFMQAKEGYFRTYADKMGDYMAEKKMLYLDKTRWLTMLEALDIHIMETEWEGI